MLNHLIGAPDEICEECGEEPSTVPLLLPLYKTAALLESYHADRMDALRHPPAMLKALCVQVCMLYSTMSLAGWALSSDAARLRCGTDLISDLIFVCGDRGIHLGKGSWSGYGSRPRGKGIVDQCCQSAGCELQLLEMYCAKPKSKPKTTALPTQTTATPTTTQLDTTQQFQAVFQKRLSEHLGAPGSPKREAYRKKTQPSLRRKSKVALFRRRNRTKSTTSGPSSASKSPLQRIVATES